MGEAIDLLVTADLLYPMTEGDPAILGGEVAVRPGRIILAGPAKPAGSWTAALSLDGRGKAGTIFRRRFRCAGVAVSLGHA